MLETRGLPLIEIPPPNLFRGILFSPRGFLFIGGVVFVPLKHPARLMLEHPSCITVMCSPARYGYPSVNRRLCMSDMQGSKLYSSCLKAFDAKTLRWGFRHVLMRETGIAERVSFFVFFLFTFDPSCCQISLLYEKPSKIVY